jgi:hypothetical protein
MGDPAGGSSHSRVSCRSAMYPSTFCCACRCSTAPLGTPVRYMRA